MTIDEDEKAFLVLRAVIALGRRLRAERPRSAITLSALGLLGTLARHGPMPATELAEAERLQPQSLTRLLTRLEGDGLIARRRSETDRRASTISLTEAGRAVLAEDLGARRAWLAEAMQRTLDPAERDGLVAAAAAMLRLALQDGRAQEAEK